MTDGVITRQSARRLGPVPTQESGTMATSQPSIKSAALELLPVSRRPVTAWQRLQFTAVTALLAIIAVLLLFAQHSDVALLLGLFGLGLAGTGLVRETVAPADTVILVGKSPMASIIASTMAARQRGPRAATVLRATHLSEAASLARAHRCDEIIVAGSAAVIPTDVVDARGLRPALVSGEEKIEQLLERIPVELAMRDAVLTRLNGARTMSTVYRAAKRGIDIAAALVIGLILLPVFPLVALAIVLDSRGPVLYSQQRVGHQGTPFRIYKFRTMRQDAEQNGAVWATQRDPRVTRIGRFMRLTRIDELPQIWNLLRGEMTLVGPRPERPEFTATLAREIHGYELRHTVKPGLTGWAQVCYRYTSSIRDTKAKVEYDLFYVKHCSLLFDLKIMLRTVKVVIGMKGQ